RPEFDPAGRGGAVLVRRKSPRLRAEAVTAVRNDEDDQPADNPADHLAADVIRNVAALRLTRQPQTGGHRGVDVATGERTHRGRRPEPAGPGRHRDPEGGGRTSREEVAGREHRGARPPDDEYQRADALGERNSTSIGHTWSSSRSSGQFARKRYRRPRARWGTIGGVIGLGPDRPAVERV